MTTNISGFPELLPRDQIAFNKVVEIIKSQFELFGFSPLDTPAVERVSTLLAKGNDSEIYGIHRLADADGNGKKELALRFDLTVPLARYVAQHYGSLNFPYKRYHIAPVWRGERPQAGRYRQFYQCDIDIIGDGELPLINDAEGLSIIYKVFKAIGLERFKIKVNNRYLLTGLIKSFSIADEHIASVMRIIDKAEKISPEAFTAELSSAGLSADNIAVIFKLINTKLSNSQWLMHLQDICKEPEFQQGLAELSEVIARTIEFGVPDEHLEIDPSLARGLSYYTGTVSETKALDFPELGSICGGGRYANLAGSFTNKKLPGVGFSIGISRLIPKMIESGMLSADQETPAQVLVTVQNKELMSYYISVANLLRSNNIATELYLNEKPLASQMKYASKKGFKFVIIADSNEANQSLAIIRQLSTGEQQQVKLSDLAGYFN